MGILMGALGGAGAAMEDYFGNRQKADLQRENSIAVDNNRGDIELKREQAMTLFRNQLATSTADKQRIDQTSRIDAAAGSIAEPGIEQKRQGILSGITDKESWTKEQQAAVDQSLAMDKQKAIQDPKTRMQAAISTSDIDPKSAATMGQSAEINQMKIDGLMQRAEDKNATARDIADIRAKAVEAAAQLRVDAANERATNGKIDTATGRMLITSEDVNIKASTSQISTLTHRLAEISQNKGGKVNPEYEAINTQIQELRDGIKQSQQTKADYLKDMGLMKSDGQSSKPQENKVVGKAPYPEGQELTGPGGKRYIVKNGVPVPK